MSEKNRPDPPALPPPPGHTDDETPQTLTVEEALEKIARGQADLAIAIGTRLGDWERLANRRHQEVYLAVMALLGSPEEDAEAGEEKPEREGREPSVQFEIPGGGKLELPAAKARIWAGRVLWVAARLVALAGAGAIGWLMRHFAHH